ncbi:hypothetical protein ACQP1W_28150 [Spirillospora sp. CA-255316]
MRSSSGASSMPGCAPKPKTISGADKVLPFIREVCFAGQSAAGGMSATALRYGDFDKPPALIADVPMIRAGV